jgi:hypothetical protein
MPSHAHKRDYIYFWVCRVEFLFLKANRQQCRVWMAPLSLPPPWGVGGVRVYEWMWTDLEKILSNLTRVPYRTLPKKEWVPVPSLPFGQRVPWIVPRVLFYTGIRRRKNYLLLCVHCTEGIPKYHIVVFNKNNTVTLKFLTAAYMSYTLLRSPDLHPPGSLYRWLGVKLCIWGVGVLCVWTYK